MAVTLRKPEVWSLLAGGEVFVCQSVPRWRKGANKVTLRKKSKKQETGFPEVSFPHSVDMNVSAM